MHEVSDAELRAPLASYNTGMRRSALFLILVLGVCRHVAAQVPLPFPKPADPKTAGAQAPKVEPPQRPGGPPGQPAPTEAMLGLPIYPTAQFITSYDAGRGQRYYLFGTNASFTEIVGYYRTVLKQKGELVYEEPPIHMFEVGRFREETMAFPPGVTVKDYTWAGSSGYLNPKRGAEPARFKTIIQIVPSPAGAPK
jgi:hypothetical protein